METLQIFDKKFEKYIPHEEIICAIGQVALRINQDYADKPNPVFLGILKGSFMFLAELLKNIDIPCEVSFFQTSSYQNEASTGAVRTLGDIPQSLSQRHIILVEDIVDTGTTIQFLVDRLKTINPASIAVTSLLLKPDAYHFNIPIKYAAMEVTNKFIVGFGLDYNQYGRNLKDIYKLSTHE